MRTYRHIQIIGCFLVLSALMTSCSKTSTSPTSQNNAEVEQFIRKTEHVPRIAVYNKTMDKIIILDESLKKNTNGLVFATTENGISFIDSETGVEYTLSSSVTFENESVVFLEGSDGSGIIFLTDEEGTDIALFGDGLGGEGSGNLVIGDETDLELTLAVVFSATSDFFFPGDPGNAETSGIAGVFAMAIDIQALQNNDFENGEDVLDFFDGYTFSWIFTENLDGDYQIGDWYYEDYYAYGYTSDDFGFNITYDFENGHLYWSSGGSLQVDDSSFGMEIDFFAWFGFLDSYGYFDEPTEPIPGTADFQFD